MQVKQGEMQSPLRKSIAWRWGALRKVHSPYNASFFAGSPSDAEYDTGKNVAFRVGGRTSDHGRRRQVGYLKWIMSDWFTNNPVRVAGSSMVRESIMRTSASSTSALRRWIS